MGLLDELDYEVKETNALQRVTQKVASTKPVAWVFQRTLFPVDKLMFKASKGKLTVPGLMAGLPVIMLTTTGAKTGKQRTMPLLGVPIDGELAVIGSNYGQHSTPGWVYNLEADPTASVTYRDHTVSVTAGRADEAQSDRAFELAAEVYPGYAKYRDRAAHREIRVFLLSPST